MHDCHKQPEVFLKDENSAVISGKTYRHYLPAIPFVALPNYLLWKGILNPLTNVLACS